MKEDLVIQPENLPSFWRWSALCLAIIFAGILWP